jgi:hypothetical protein
MNIMWYRRNMKISCRKKMIIISRLVENTFK